MTKAEKKLYAHQYYLKHKEEILQRNRKWNYAHYHDRQNYKLIHAKEQMKIKRQELFDLMGGKCLVCGYSDTRALQIDHINGGGSKELKAIGNNRLRYLCIVIASYKANEGKYQLLCSNCNWIKRAEDRECRMNGRKAWKYISSPMITPLVNLPVKRTE